MVKIGVCGFETLPYLELTGLRFSGITVLVHVVGVSNFGGWLLGKKPDMQ